MEKIKTWFLRLSRVGKMSVISAAALSTIALGSMNPASPESSPAQISPATEAKVPVVSTKIEEETKPIPYESTQREDGSVAKGTTYIETVGVNGLETLTHTITMTDGIESNRATTSKITTAPIGQVTVIGTYVKPAAPIQQSICDSNYSGCVPIVSYDLNCSDIGFQVTVLGYDKHGFDGNDNDGLGCESY